LLFINYFSRHAFCSDIEAIFTDEKAHSETVDTTKSGRAEHGLSFGKTECSTIDTRFLSY